MLRGQHSSDQKSSRFAPTLARTVQLALLGSLLLLSLVLWLSIPILSGIIDKAAQVKHENLPELTRWRYNTQRIEQLYGFIETIYWTYDHSVARNSRLQSQVLIDSFAFEAGSDMSQRARALMDNIQALGALRDERRANFNLMHRYAQNLLEMAHSSHLDQRDAIGELAAASMKVGLVDVNWSSLKKDAQTIIATTPVPASNTENTKQIFSLLQQLQAQFSVLDLFEQRINTVYKSALQQQRELAILLNTDAVMKTQQIASDVEQEAERVRSYSIWILLIVSSITLCVPWLFQRLLVRPILHCSRALQQISTGKEVTLPDRTLLQELDTICLSVRQYSDMTHKLQQANQELLYLARHDGLTGLANRRNFDEALENEHARARRNQSDLTLILLDIDHFKRLNDQYGHPFGDACLRKLADVLREFSRRPGDLAARYGGEEFAIILPDTGLEQGKTLMERLRVAVSKLVLISEEGMPVSFTISAGLVHVNGLPHYKPKDLIHLADLALYRAKQSGRNRVEIAVTDVFTET